MQIVEIPIQIVEIPMQIDNTHKGFAGVTLISRIQDELDACYEQYMHASKSDTIAVGSLPFFNGQVEGLSAALAILRGCSVVEQRKQVHQRYLAKLNAEDGVVT